LKPTQVEVVPYKKQFIDIVDTQRKRNENSKRRKEEKRRYNNNAVFIYSFIHQGHYDRPYFDFNLFVCE
jgi:hypothetical protein